MPASRRQDFGRLVRRFCVSAQSVLFRSVLLVMASAAVAVAAPPGAPIVNQASVTFADAIGRPSTVFSNEVTLITAVLRSPAAVDIVRPAAGASGGESIAAAACLQGGGYQALDLPPVPAGAPVADLAPANSHSLGERLFLRVIDADQNTDYRIVDFVDVALTAAGTADEEHVRLFETGPDTGVFAGSIDSASGFAANDCVLAGEVGADFSVRYTDPADAADSAQAMSRFDPSGRVFDSLSGAAVDGARVELLDASTGKPAVAYGIDGRSAFPAEIISGQSTTDAAGERYEFSDGRFRYPLVPAGSYVLRVTPPDEWSAPSIVADADLQALPGAPWRISAASYSEPFTLAADGPLLVDYPVDPRRVTFFVQKTAAATVAAPGDFVPYEVSVANLSDAGTTEDVRLRDLPPRGARYVAGSATLDGDALGDPQRGPDGALVFALGSLAADQTVTVRYLLEIVAGSDGDILENRATAEAPGGLVSNEATASLSLREELFRSRGHIMGRVVEGSCELDAVDEDRGVAGVRVYLEDGRYAVTDEGGRFHFEGVLPGTHIAQLDAETVPAHYLAAGCNTDPRFAGRGDSRILELMPGSLYRADFHLQRRAPPEGVVVLVMTNAGTAIRDRVAYELQLAGTGDIEVGDLQVTVLLPEGVSYRRDSLRIQGRGGTEPRLSQQSLTVELPPQRGDWRLALTFQADIDPSVSGDLSTRAIARFVADDTHVMKSPVAETMIRREAATWENEGYVLGLQFGVLSAELSDDDRRQLDRLVESWRDVRDVRITAVGHSDSTPIAARSRATFADNYVLSRARAAAAAHYIADVLDVDAADVSVEGRGPDDPVATNATAAGRKQNRRVELVLAGQRPGRQSFVEVARESSGVLATETRGAVPGSEVLARSQRDEAALAAHLEPPVQSETPLDALEPGIAWVLPQPGYRPPIPAMRIAIQHAPDQSVALFVNGLEVDPANFAGRDSDIGRQVAVSRWAGVELLEGTNQLVADIVGADGRIADRLTERVHYAGAPVRAELVREASRLVADGKTRPRIAIRLFDRYGEPARHSSVGAYSIDAPYRSWWAVENDRQNKLVHVGNREPLYTVGDEGIAYIELEPTTESGEARLRLRFANQREQELSTWLEPAVRDWILVGFGEGTLGYRTLTDNADVAETGGDGYYDEGRLAFFAKGRIRGDYLLTLAYDSARDENRARQEFRQSGIDPDAWYTLYADASEQRFEAQSQRKLFVKIERRQFNALFGDFATGLTTADLARYERRMNGLRSEYSGRHLAYKLFASENAQNFVRDEIQGDGTSGLYRLSAAPIIAQSETVRIETRDRFDQATVLSSRTLTRFLDYDLDPLRGTLFFKQPVPSRDQRFDPVFIVVEYETDSRVSGDLTAGGRVAVRSAERGIEIGVTHIAETQPAASADLTATDIQWQVSERTRLRAELASTSSDQPAAGGSGQASLVAVEHRGEQLDLRAEFREVDQSFGLGQQARAEQGIRRMSVDGRYEINSEVNLRGRSLVQENLETGTERVTAELAAEYRSERSAATVGVTHAEDRFVDGERHQSDILDVGVSRRLFESALSLRANGSFGLSGRPENADYLSSYVVGADYELRPEVDLFVEYETAEGRHIDAEMTRLGIRASPWSRAQLSSSLVNEMSEFGPRLYSNLGLVQGFQLNDNWLLDVGIDRTSTLRGSGYRQFDDERQPAFGSNGEDFSAGYVGTVYQAGSWSINSRIEYRRSESDERLSLLSGWYREASQGHALSAGLTLFASDSDTGFASLGANLRFGWALRRADSPWMLLYRADLGHERRRAEIDDATWRVISNLNANRRLSAASQIGLQYAAKYVNARFGDLRVDGVTDLYGVDYRVAFRDRWEVAVHGSALHSWRADTLDYGAGTSLGYRAADDLWISLGYNVRGFHDEDFAASRYTASGPYLRITLRGHQSALKRISGR